MNVILFDFFGTLVPTMLLSEHKEVLKAMSALVNVPAEYFTQRWFETFNDRALGIIPSVEFNVKLICNEVDVVPGEKQLAECVEMRFAYGRRVVVPRSDALSTLKRLKDDGYRLGLITDCSTELPLLWHTLEFSQFFDTTVFSCIEGMKKPDPRMYHKACNALNVSPEECIYVGDGGSHELSGAKAVGMYAVHLCDEAEGLSGDAHRIDGEIWDGPKINALHDIFGVIDRDFLK